MSNVPTWSTTAGSNNSSPPNGWPEGMARSAVNDTAREMMAALAKWFQDARGSLTTAGGTTAYTLTTNAVYTALTQIPVMAVRFNAANTTTTPTLAVDGLAATTIGKAGGGTVAVGDLTTNKLYLIAYNSGASRFDVLNLLGADTFASGTVMLFQQTSAPTSWTKGSTHNNKALRLVTGTASSGGSTAFTSVLTSRTIAQANLPNVNLSHSLGVSTEIDTGDAVVFYDGSGFGGVQNAAPGRYGFNGDALPTTGDLALNNGGVTGTISLGGSGTAMDFDVQYVDVILATKD